MKNSEKIVKIMTLNIGNPSIERAKIQAQWLKERPEDIFVLTETKNSIGCNYIANYLQKEGFCVSFPKNSSKEYGVMCASRLPIASSLTPFPEESKFYCRHLENDICLDDETLHIVGLYVPSRNQSPEKIVRKKTFLEESFEFIEKIKVPTIICGDLNILDRNHVPHYRIFRDWEYKFYDNLIRSGYVDTFRHCYPKLNDYSWVGRTGDGYRYDYCFVSEAMVDRILDCRFVHETREMRLTDHSALVTDFLILF